MIPLPGRHHRDRGRARCPGHLRVPGDRTQHQPHRRRLPRTGLQGPTGRGGPGRGREGSETGHAPLRAARHLHPPTGGAVLAVAKVHLPLPATLRRRAARRLRRGHTKEALEPRQRDKIYIPKVYEKHTTRKVLVTEWIEGAQLAKSPPEVINQLIPVGVECFLIQLLETGFFHADPHPGNLLVTPEGKLALIDFGLMADVPIQDTKTMTKTIVHLMQGDVPGLVEDAIELGFLPEDVDKASLTPVLQQVFDSAQLAVTDQVKSGLTFRAVQGRRKQFMAVSFDLNKIFYTYPFLVPDYFALITRAMIVLEGIAVTGDPDFDLFKAAYPYSLKRAVKLFGLGGVASLAKEVSGRLREMGVDDTLVTMHSKELQL